MSKKGILIILFVIILLLAGLFVLRQAITNQIRKKVIENTMLTDNPEIIKKEIERLDIAIKLNPNKYLYYTTRADLNCKIKQFETALSDLKRIHKFKKDYAEGYFYQGLIYDWIGNSDSASINYEKSENFYNKRIKSETNSDLIKAHEYNIFVLKVLQKENVVLQDYESDTSSYRYKSLETLKQSDRTDLVNELLID